MCRSRFGLGPLSAYAERHSPARQVVEIQHRLYVPVKLHAGESYALVVALHGCTQTADDFAAGTQLDMHASRHRAIVLYPQQSDRANPQCCWNWFLPEHQRRESGEPAAILGLVASVRERYEIDALRICVVGLSAGGAMAAILAECAPDVFSGLGIMAGLPLQGAHDVASALRLMNGDEPASSVLRLNGRAELFKRMRVMIWTGREDRLVAPINSRRLQEQFRALLGLRGPAESEVRESIDILRRRDSRGRSRLEFWQIEGLGHAWSGGSLRGTFTSPGGPVAAALMLNYLLASY